MQGWGWTENGKHSANHNVLAVCQGNVTLRIAVDKPHRAVAPCRVKRQWHTETAMSSEPLRKLNTLQDCILRTTVNGITNIKQAAPASKSRQGKTSTKRRHINHNRFTGLQEWLRRISWSIWPICPCRWVALPSLSSMKTASKNNSRGGFSSAMFDYLRVEAV